MASESDERESQDGPTHQPTHLETTITNMFKRQEEVLQQTTEEVQENTQGIENLRHFVYTKLHGPLFDFMTQHQKDEAERITNEADRENDSVQLLRTVEGLKRHVDSRMRRNTEDLKQHLDSRTAQGFLSSISSIDVNFRGSGAGKSFNATGFPVNLIQDRGQSAADGATRPSNNDNDADRPDRRRARRQTSPRDNSEDTPMTKEEINSRIAKLLRRDQKALLVHLLRGFDGIDQSDIWNQVTQDDSDTSGGRGHSEGEELGDEPKEPAGGNDDGASRKSSGSKEGDEPDKDDDMDDSQDPKKGRRSRRDDYDEGGMGGGSGDGMGDFSNLFSREKNNEDLRGQRRQSPPASPKSQPSPGPSGADNGRVDHDIGRRHRIEVKEGEDLFGVVEDSDDNDFEQENFDQQPVVNEDQQNDDDPSGNAVNPAESTANDAQGLIENNRDNAETQAIEGTVGRTSGGVWGGKGGFITVEETEAINALPPDPEPSRKQKKEMAASGLQDTAASQQTDGRRSLRSSNTPQPRTRAQSRQSSVTPAPARKTPSIPKASTANATNGSDSGQPRRTGTESEAQRQPKRKNNEPQDPPPPKKARTDAMAHGQEATSAARSTQNIPSPIQEADDEDDTIHVMPPLDHGRPPSFSPFTKPPAKGDNSKTVQQPTSSASQPNKKPQLQTATKTKDEPDRSKMPPPPVPANTRPAAAMSNPVRQTPPNTEDMPSRKRARDEPDSDSENSGTLQIASD